MKWLLLPSAALFACFADAYTIPELGSDEAAIIKQLGEPSGSITLSDKLLLLYPQGEITLRDGIATEVDIMPEAKFASHQAKLEREREEWKQRSAELSAANLAEGKRIKATKLESTDFAKLPARNRLAFWREFQSTYPEVDVHTQLSDADDAYQAELAKLQSEREMADLKAKIAQSEKETAEAELEAQRLRNELKKRSHFGLRYYTDPVIKRKHYYYRPPIITVYSNGKTYQHRPQNMPGCDLRQYRTTTSQNQVNVFSKDLGSFRFMFD